MVSLSQGESCNNAKGEYDKVTDFLFEQVGTASQTGQNEGETRWLPLVVASVTTVPTGL